MYFVCFCLLARGYTARESRYNRGKLIEIHRDWMKTRNPDASLFIQYRHLVVVIVLEVISFGASEVDNQKHDQQGDD